jgi:hypothetical protein
MPIPDDPAHSLAALSPFQATLMKRRQGLLTRLLRRPALDDAVHALSGILAGRDPRGITAAEVTSVLQRYAVRGRHARVALSKVWRFALEKFVTDDAISEREAEYLESLRRVLSLSDWETSRIEHEVFIARYRLAAGQALADGQLTQAEREGIERLNVTLRIPPDIHTAIWTELARPLLDRRLNELIADRRISPRELQDFRDYARSLGFVQVSFGGEVEAALDRYSLLWRIENGQLPSVAVPIVLQKDETCFWSGPAEWHELRTKTTRVNYGGPVASIRIMKGLRWRLGSVAVSRVTREEVQRLDAGTLYITSKRILLSGAYRNYQLRYSAILGIEVFSDAIRIEKASGRSPVVVLQDPEIPAAILSAELAAQG